MKIQKRSFSMQPMNAMCGMLCLVSMVCQGTVHGTEPDKSDAADVPNKVARAKLRDEPAFQKQISGEFRNPKAQDILDLVRKETGKRLTLDASVIQDRPLMGHKIINQIPAWDVLESLAQQRYIKGYWVKRGEEYVLIARYSGPPPPLPREPPPHLRAAMEKAEKGIPPDPPPERTPSAPPTRRRIWWAASWLTFATLFVGVIFWRRKTSPSTTAKTPLPRERK